MGESLPGIGFGSHPKVRCATVSAGCAGRTGAVAHRALQHGQGAAQPPRYHRSRLIWQEAFGHFYICQSDNLKLKVNMLNILFYL